VQPKALLDVAENLLNDATSGEGNLRGAAHCAYYAVYHLVCDHYGLDPKNNYASCDHATMRARLRNERNVGALPPHMRIARRYFDGLFDRRRRADYHLDDQFPQGDAEDAVEWAKAVFGAMVVPAAAPQPTSALSTTPAVPPGTTG